MLAIRVVVLNPVHIKLFEFNLLYLYDALYECFKKNIFLYNTKTRLNNKYT